MALCPQIIRSFGCVERDPRFLRAAQALALETKNLRNTAVFIVRAFWFGLQADGTVRPKTKVDIVEWAKEANAFVKAWNADALKEYEAEHAKKVPGGMGPPRVALPASKQLRLFLPELTEPAGADGKPCSLPRAKRDDILNMTLLRALVCDRKDDKGRVVFKALPGTLACETLQRVIKDFKTHKKTVAAWHKGPKKTRRPQPPGFKGKNELATMIFPSGSAFSFEKGIQAEGRRMRFPGLRDNAGNLRKVCADYAQTDWLTETELLAFRDYDLQGAWEQAKAKNKTPAGARLSEVRVIPQKDGSVKVEFVMDWDKRLKKGSFAERMFAQLEAIDPEMPPSKFNDQLLKRLKSLSLDELPVMAGSDPGVNNLISVATTEGSAAIVVSAASLERKLGWFDSRIDSRKSKLTTPELRALIEKREKAQEVARAKQEAAEAAGEKKVKAAQGAAAQAKKAAAKAKKEQARQEKSEALEREVARSAAFAQQTQLDVEQAQAEMAAEAERLAEDATGALTPSEFAKLRNGLAAIYRDSTLIDLWARRARVANDFLHKTSKGLIRQLRERKVELLVLGHNPGWKDEAGMDTAQNRRLYSIAHGKLFEFLKYKALEAGILAVEVEESYTSQTSFVMSEALRKHRSAMTAQEKAEQKAARAAQGSKKQALAQTLREAMGNKKKKAANDDAAARSPASADTGFSALASGENLPARKESEELAGQKKPSWAAEGKRKGHFFTSLRAPEGERVVHADVNGAFNILRKACPAFKHNDKLSLKFRIWWLHPKKGLAQRQLRREKTAP